MTSTSSRQAPLSRDEIEAELSQYPTQGLLAHFDGAPPRAAAPAPVPLQQNAAVLNAGCAPHRQQRSNPYPPVPKFPCGPQQAAFEFVGDAYEVMLQSNQGHNVKLQIPPCPKGHCPDMWEVHHILMADNALDELVPAASQDPYGDGFCGTQLSNDELAEQLQDCLATLPPKHPIVAPGGQATFT